MAFGDPKPDGGNKSAEGILTQIKGLLNQYQGLGEGTPLFEESKQFEADVDRALDQVKGEAESPEEDTAEGGEASESEGKSSPPSDFRGATKAASEAMKADGNYVENQGQPKTGPEDLEQADEEEEKRKKGTKAGS